MRRQHTTGTTHVPDAWPDDPGPWPGDPQYRTLAAAWDRQRRRLVEYGRARRDLDRDAAEARAELARLARLAAAAGGPR